MSVKVRKNASGKWGCIINMNGKQKTVVVGTKRAATMLKDEIELQIARDKLGFMEPTVDVPSFKEVADEWLEGHKEHLRVGSLSRYKSALRIYVLPFYGKRPINSISRPEILKHLRGLHKGTIQGKNKLGYHKGEKIKASASLINIISAVLSQVFIYALDLELIESTPMNNIGRSLRFKKNKHNAKPFTAEELDRILDNADDEWKLFFLFAFRTGCRIGECLAIHWSDLDLEAGTIIIQRSADQRKRIGLTKNGKERTISLSPQLVDELRIAKAVEYKRCLKEGIKPMIVFHSRTNDYLFAMRVRRAWKSTLKKASLEYIKFHHIRHTVASLLIASGLDPKAVQHQLGHSSIGMTMDLYTHYIAKDEAITGVLDSSGYQTSANGLSLNG